jgi:tetratricopeptide (TPR) repeat protein
VGCLNEETVLGFLKGTLPPDRVATVDEHVEGCRSCRDLLVVAARGSDIEDIARSPTLGAEAAAPARRGLGRGASVGRYVVIDVLGEGGMGVVYAAFDPELDRKIAVKLLRGEADDEGSGGASRLLREGRAIAKLAHPNVVTVFDVGTHEGSVFVAMELVDGQSLDVWLRQPHTWREVLAIYLQAGAGLVAAHAAGIVHRDFKPANVLIGSDGRARVSDFGLARLDEAPRRASGPALAAASEAGLSLTRTGAIMGTPAYMAPEQFEAAATDARTDEFSFAVALYEGLYGERPFAGATLAEIFQHISDGEVRPAPAATAVPARLRQIVLRGLRAAPSERYSTVEDMLAELRATIGRRKRLWGLAGVAGIAVSATALGVVGVLALGGGGTDPCAAADRGIDEVWGLGQRAEIGNAFAKVRVPYAGDALAGVARQLDGFSAQWRAMQLDSCRATQIQHVQTEEQQGVRTVCLGERLAELSALVDLLGHADAELVRNAVRAAERLTPVAICGDLRALTAEVRPPADPITRARVDALEQRLASARALGIAGKYKAGYEAAKRVAVEAEPLGYKPLLARALHEAGRLAERAGEPAAAAQLLTRAVQSAVAGRADRTEAMAWIDLVHAVGVGEGRDAEALTDIDHASAAIERLGGDPLLEAALDGYRASVLADAGKFEPARVAAERALATRKRLLPPDHLDIAASLAQLGDLQRKLGKFDESRVAHMSALAIRERALGPNHPEVASTLQDLGNSQIDLGDVRAAEASYRRSLAIREAALGPDHPEIASLLNALGTALRIQGRYDDAAAVLQRALAIADRHFGKKHQAYTAPLYTLGAVYMQQQKYELALRTLDEGIALLTELQGPDFPDLAKYYAAKMSVYADQQKWPEAYAANAHATAIDLKAYGPEHPAVLTSYAMLGELYLHQDRVNDAISLYEQLVVRQEKALGKDSPALAVSLSNLANALALGGRYAESRDVYRRALALDEKQFGPEGPDLIYDLVGLGDALAHVGANDEAIAVLERALTLDAAKVDPNGASHARFYLAKSLWDANRDRPHALALIRQARAESVQHADAQTIRAIDHWLQRHHY